MAKYDRIWALVDLHDLYGKELAGTRPAEIPQEIRRYIRRTRSLPRLYTLGIEVLGQIRTAIRQKKKREQQTPNIEH